MPLAWLRRKPGWGPLTCSNVSMNRDGVSARGVSHPPVYAKANGAGKHRANKRKSQHKSPGRQFGVAEQVIEPICSSPGFAWLANAFMADGWGWHPKVEMKAVWIQSEERVTYKKELETCRHRSVGKHAESRD